MPEGKHGGDNNHAHAVAIGVLAKPTAKLDPAAANHEFVKRKSPTPRPKARAGFGPPLGSASRARTAHKKE